LTWEQALEQEASKTNHVDETTQSRVLDDKLQARHSEQAL
jgi:hypothetical protein